jgi:hypothetical protein
MIVISSMIYVPTVQHVAFLASEALFWSGSTFSAEKYQLGVRCGQPGLIFLGLATVSLLQRPCSLVYNLKKTAATRASSVASLQQVQLLRLAVSGIVPADAGCATAPSADKE